MRCVFFQKQVFINAQAEQHTCQLQTQDKKANTTQKQHTYTKTETKHDKHNKSNDIIKTKYKLGTGTKTLNRKRTDKVIKE